MTPSTDETLHKSWPYYRTWPFTGLREVLVEHMRRMWHDNKGCSLLRTSGLVLFETCICSSCWYLVQYFFMYVVILWTLLHFEHPTFFSRFHFGNSSVVLVLTCGCHTNFVLCISCLHKLGYGWIKTHLLLTHVQIDWIIQSLLLTSNRVWIQSNVQTNNS